MSFVSQEMSLAALEALGYVLTLAIGDHVIELTSQC